jgi:hypothetical protein
MLNFYEENSVINFDYWEPKFWQAYGYYPKLDPCCTLPNGEDDPKCLADVEGDRRDFLNFIKEESDNPDRPYP